MKSKKIFFLTKKKKKKKAPELFSKTAYTEKCDVFSLGVLFWEIVNTVAKGKYETPYSEYPNLKADFQIFYSVAKKNMR